MFMYIKDRILRVKNKKAFTLRSQTRKPALPAGRQFGEVGQTLSEYAIVIGVAMAAILSMQPFIRMRIQAILRDNIDTFGSQAESETQPILGSLKYSTFTTELTDKTFLNKEGYQEDRFVHRSGNFIRTDNIQEN